MGDSTDAKLDKGVKIVLVIIGVLSIAFTAVIIAGAVTAGPSSSSSGGEDEAGKTEAFACPFCKEGDVLCTRLALEKVYAGAWNDLMEADPISATYYGLNSWNDKLTNMSMHAIEQRMELDKHYLQCAQTFTSAREELPASDRLNFDLFVWMMESRREYDETKWYLTPTNQLFSGPQIELPQALLAMPFSNGLSDYTNYLVRLDQVPTYIDEVIELMREGLSAGVTVPKVPVRSVSSQIAAIFNTSVEDSVFYIPFKQLFGSSTQAMWAPAVIQSGIQTLTNTVFPAYERFYQFWVNEYYPHLRDTVSMSALPSGLAHYQSLVHYHTTTNMTYQEVHDLGLREVSRIRAEMEQVMARAMVDGAPFNGTLADFIAFLRSSPQFYFDTEEALLTHVQSIVKRAETALPSLFGTLPRCPVGVKAIPAELAPSAPGAYYEDPDIDCTRPGMYNKNTFDLSSRPSFAMQSTSLHEAVPGHHLQIALAKEIKGVPPFRRMVHPTAFIEGWALYAESLGAEMGFYTSDFDYFGRLNDEIFRACRLVVDTGMHALGWSRQEAIDFMTANSALGKTDIEAEIDRYIVMPGQALSYKVGELAIQELKKVYSEKLDLHWNVRVFHDAVLGNGAVTLDLLEDVVASTMEAYLNSKTSSEALSIERVLAALPTWSVAPGGITKIFEFGSFAEATAWLTSAVQHSEELDHHPDINIVEATVTMHMSTKSCKCITHKDVYLARRLDRTYSSVQSSSLNVE
uniref:4a-hydroxytetrahydrobiopterin dehydratase n=1 Tax=Palpitomonas bilix TaxID=652834 RepID=A0A7S3G728_9EUKA|mmetsp:Transcript_35102/g.91080  ORF Transcript_35102/g.91080 Transcript_35102/m.91080 type:complete len:745 (+) Transcript_35102:69-2303(+)